ncbi:MAG: sulfotransferase domain-containing protein [Bacteroidales bacterium]|nr:sulfotransferase domain-containing protein [Bacteroidales bacterium]
MSVNMLIIGAGRSGTTTLYEHLKSHPDICFSNIKEIPFFSVEDIYQRGESYYHSFFKPINQKITASSDTYLLIDNDAPLRISTYNPDMKFIIMLREPVARSYSSFNYAINNGHENKTTTFRDSFTYEKEKISNQDIIIRNNLGHFYTGLYHKHIKYWMQFFQQENFLLIKTTDLSENYEKVLKNVSKFLNIEEFPKKAEIRTNKASGVKFIFLHKLLIDRDSKLRKLISRISPDSFKKSVFNSGIIQRLKRLNKKEYLYEPISKEDKKFVEKHFEEDLQLLKDEFGISF